LPDSRRQSRKLRLDHQQICGLRADDAADLVHSAVSLQHAAGHCGKTLIPSSKCLIALKKFLLKISSICLVSGLARLRAGCGGISAQSYPHVL
jgi:hypothetical protein